MSDILQALAEQNPKSVHTNPEPMTQLERAMMEDARQDEPTPTHPTRGNKNMSYSNTKPRSNGGAIPATIDELFPSPWLTSQDIQRSHTVTISALNMVEVYDKVGRQHIQKLALSLNIHSEDGNIAPARKRLLVNKTQAEELAKLTGSRKLADWQGKTVILQRARSHNGKDTIGIIRA